MLLLFVVAFLVAYSHVCKYRTWENSVSNCPVYRTDLEEEENMSTALKILALSTVLVSAIGASGCATTGDNESLQAEIAAANSAADQAATDAASAKSDAAAARAAAEEARDSAAKTNEKLDRMFKKSMYK